MQRQKRQEHFKNQKRGKKMSNNTKTYYLVIYDKSLPKGVNFAMPTILSKEDANVLLQDAMPIIDRKKNGRRYKVTEKRIFNYHNKDGDETLFIVCDAERVSKLKK